MTFGDVEVTPSGGRFWSIRQELLGNWVNWYQVDLSGGRNQETEGASCKALLIMRPHVLPEEQLGSMHAECQLER